ncbi:MarR family transcriptional regulator [Enterococcus hulanensis]|uniref:MarR family transcriptional regulator n=1 Tax=Enterococcus hulanensis TaxID=2559929 RepID=A0ABU3EUI9_9ENTE|nr:MarR family transcriptional regulator [Enterococcus hulanensis]MDT2598541.1 MarR family transcriptional regulator [Enterococcus hulanensis]MDT2607954.1 MarR family transcriptional regulator [Enterococcus hulanensis]MDT2615249.1 MarR family transcriptional regulator [Enterococcus hulanensis]MDT2626780.1 MarR family transcriptional regulator [Enterococcus hulanensis]MDT2654321.1 MarR family transcriptional regulator [Enterococcus hulanensis]
MTDVLREIGKIARALDSIANIEFKEYQLSKGQYLYLTRIFENPGIIPDKLAEMIKVDRTTAARAIKKLEEKGFIEKKPDSKNKKIRRLFVTAEGAELAPIIQLENEYSNQIALQNLSAQEVEAFTKTLRTLTANIDEEWLSVKKGNKRPYLKQTKE